MRTRDIEERDERNRAIAQFYESSELVDSLVFSNPWDPSGFTIYWRGDGLGEFSPLWMAGGGREPSAPSDSMTVAAGHESAIELFWLAMNQGYLLVLVRPGWQFACLGDKTEITVDVISTIRKGDEPDSAQVVESCFRSWMTVNTFRKWMNPAPSK